MKLRKLGALILSLTLTLSLCAVPAAAAESDFTIKNGVLTKYTGSGGAVTIPNSVTHIGESAFVNCTGLTSVTIPDSVTKIGEWAFYDCRGLINVTIPGSVTTIGENAFRDCTGLTSVIIPDSVTTIGEDAFASCNGLTSITIPNSITEIADGTFSFCFGLTTVTIPDSVTKIGAYAFGFCFGLTSVTIPDSVTTISQRAFESTPWLHSLGEFAISNHILLAYQGPGGAVVIPNGVTTIGERAFEYCSGLTSVTIPNSVTKIGKIAFPYCSGLTGITFPNSVTEIAGGAFEGCSGLASVTFPDSVTTIGECAFSGCTGLTTVTIPDSVTKIGEKAFWGCPNRTIYGSAGSYAEKFAKEEHILFVAGKAPAVPTAVPIAYAAPQIVRVDGKEMQFTAYALKDADGNMTNYFKVRDVASVLGGTAAQFAVEWDGAVNLKAGAAYTPNGSEMTLPFAGNQPYKQIAGDTLVSGAAQKLAAITLTDAKGNGYTYYKLRDLGDALGFQVDWNGKNITIVTAP